MDLWCPHVCLRKSDLGRATSLRAEINPTTPQSTVADAINPLSIYIEIVLTPDCHNSDHVRLIPSGTNDRRNAVQQCLDPLKAVHGVLTKLAEG